MVSSGKLSSRVTHSSSKSQARKKIKLGLKSRGTRSNSNTKISSQGLWPSSKDLVEIKHYVQSILRLTVPSIEVLSIPGQSVCTLRDLANTTLAAINSCALLKSVQPDLELVLSHGTTALRKGQGNFYTVNSTIDKQVHVIVPADKNLIALRVAGANEASPPKEQSEESCRYSTAVASADQLVLMLNDFQHKNPNCKKDWKSLWDTTRTSQAPRNTYELFRRSIWPMYNMAGVEEGRCKMIQFVTTLTKYDGMTDLLARTPQLFTEKKIKSIDQYIRANPKARIEVFLKSAAAHIPLHDHVDSLDDGSLRDDSLEDDDGSLKDDGLEDDLEDDAFEQWEGIDDCARYGRT
ncbi:hypothetical protein C8R48DRAFT_782785 [Suillus tomentosus]|nr:hypothetical protein C8R48DRAFT_782785 [Suillus tomentosus]